MKFLRKIMSGIMPSCAEASRLASRSLDEKLPLTRRFALWLHQRICGLCRRYSDQLKFMHEAASQSEEKQPAPTEESRLSKAARDRLKEKLRSATKDGE